MDVFQAMAEMRAMRRLKPDPIPRAEIEEIIRYATHAPSGSNAQGWRFIVVTDAEKKREIGGLYNAAVKRYLDVGNTAPQPHQTREEWEALKKAVRWQGEHLHEAPAIIFPCLRNSRRGLGHPAGARGLGASIYPAVQNLLLACRAKGIGATLTTLHFTDEAEVVRILGLPEDAATFALIPIGYPMGKFGPTKRVAVSEVIGWERWE